MQQAKHRSDMRRTEQFILSYHEAFFLGGGGGGAGGRSCDCFHCVTHYFPCLGGRLGTRHQLVQYKALKTLSISAKSGR